MKLKLDEVIELENKIKSTVDTLNDIYNFNLKYPKYYFDIKNSTAGMAKSISMTIHFNILLAIENWNDFIKITVPHEICHLGVFQLLKTGVIKKLPRPHGATWKLMMHEVNAPSRTTHNFNVENIKSTRKKHEYACDCKEPIFVTSIIHNRIKKGYNYICKKCRNIIIKS